ncbi:FtsX-like permease family protein [Parasulfitobacter algicola]|uniref:FtsX-like permease family protein n=1 Tax=Parasulfitobacter algicola TaxID=2614809 RepID=A0ABX2IVD2_9RHOB|nr:FtsX-like permease family protein [Sulfitobacter algicola]NSX56882.1 FtsX-like permease family protein [Sulfitobacter algicola]
MTWILERLLGRLPLGWLQLINRKGRFFSATLGVGFAVTLVLFQLGFIGALSGSVQLPYQAIRADFILSGPDARTLTDGTATPRQRVYEALSVNGIDSASPFYIGTAVYKIPNGRDASFRIFGVEPETLATFWREDIAQFAPILEVARTATIDGLTRGVPPDFLNGVGTGAPQPLNLNGIPVGLVGTFEIGPGFDSDGYIFVSTRTFFQIFPEQDPGAPAHVFVKVAPGQDLLSVRQDLEAQYDPTETLTRSIEEALADEVMVQTVEAPIGIIFGFGAVMGVFVGLVIVYQVLSTEVSDHIREYATLKAVGYRNRFFSSIVLEQAAILGICGFVPGALLATVLYGMISGATGLPMVMEQARLTNVLIGTLVACAFSGLLAARRLRAAEPAELY